ncbi:MAG: Nif3-like dinuclear metal center hexameric protein [Victivallaceae bacterium]|nr:Nif3-like dinuclear metal center hexameric protein [Victivallaceae bacterium]
MATLDEITGYFDNLLGLAKIPADGSNNGLQVEGSTTVNKILFSVDASLELFNIAVERNADMVFVHHGISWGGNPKRFSGMDGDRLRTLFCNGISLYAMHLPLDAHPEYGHNACLAAMLGLENQTMFAKYCEVEIGVIGELPELLTPQEIADSLDAGLDGESIVFGDAAKSVSKIGIISGGAGYEGINEAIKLGLDCFITGEVGHSSYHLIKESGMPVVALGHYSSEKPGVIKSMELIQAKFNVECEFIDIPTGL